MRLRGATVVVTGAAAGIGEAIVRELAPTGAHLVAVDIDGPGLDKLSGALPDITVIQADLTTVTGRNHVTETTGAIDVLVNDAGIAWLGALADMGDDDVERMVGLNLTALIDLSRRVLPGMLARRHGHIVNIGSINGWLAAPPLTVYSATKAAVEAFSAGLRRETTGLGVDVTLVAPGPVRSTGALTAGGGSPQSRGFLEAMFAVVAVPPSWVAKAVRFAVEHPGLPGTRTITVPAVAGLTRLARFPGVTPLVDLGVTQLRDRAGLV